MDSIEEFHLRLLQEIRDNVNESGISEEESFFDQASARLVAAGEIETADRAYYEGSRSNKTIRIDGSGGDPGDAEGVLSVIICDFHAEPSPVTINAAAAKQLFGRLVNFLFFTENADFVASLEQGSPAAGLTEMVSERWNSMTKIKLIIITNANYSARTDATSVGKFKDIPFTCNIWDLNRLYRFESSGQTRDDLVVDFKNEFGGAVPALSASHVGAELESFLLVIPGTQLAEVYDKWGARLIESNVRSFLQARGKVNQGIRDTIRSEAKMFFSYNNGISATADSVEMQQVNGQLCLVSASNLQIVNGGQTTASIHAARRSAPESLRSVRVQMKLTVVPPELSEEIVPKISQFANSQNKVSAADFFSNHRFHVRMEEFSRRVLAPASEITNKETKWFYERARGQYLVERAKRTDAERKRFDTEYPKSQLFTKTDLAKVEFSFQCRPDSVSRGAQKNFADFAKEIGDTWSRNESSFDESWYRHMVAKLIVFRFLEKAIPKQSWYPGGYRANIVTYAIAKHVLGSDEDTLTSELEAVWKLQRLSPRLVGALLRESELASYVITRTPAGIRNVTEWAKKANCWEALKRSDYSMILTATSHSPPPKDTAGAMTENENGWRGVSLPEERERESSPIRLTGRERPH